MTTPLYYVVSCGYYRRWDWHIPYLIHYYTAQGYNKMRRCWQLLFVYHVRFKTPGVPTNMLNTPAQYSWAFQNRNAYWR